MCGELDGEHGKVDDTDVCETVHREVRAEDAARRLREHRARERRELGADRAREPFVPAVVGLHRTARGDLVADGRAERGRVADLACDLQTLAEDDGVGVASEALRVDDGQGEGVVEQDVDVALREGALGRG